MLKPVPDSVTYPLANNQLDATKLYRILMIAPTSFFADYGCHIRILEEARILQAMGHEVTLVTYHNGNDVPDLQIKRTLPIPWRRHYLVGSSRHKIVFDMLLGVKTVQVLAAKQLAGKQFDIIHAHLHEGALIGLLLGKFFGLPVVFDFQGSLTEEMIDHGFLKRHSLFYKPWRLLERWIDHHSRIIFTSSAQAERVLLQQFGCDPARVRVLPDCATTSIFKPANEFEPSQLAALRQQLGIPDHCQLIVYLGLLAAYQGTDLLLVATQQILQENPNVRLLLMGFPNENYYRQQAIELDIQEAVLFTGRVPYEQAPLYLALGDVAAAPKMSLTEGAGKLLNYMATALPTVAFDTPVAREYLGLDGLFAELGNVQSLAEKLSYGLGLAARAKTDAKVVDLGQRLRRRVVQKFSWHKAGQQIIDAYRQLLGDGASPDPITEKVQLEIELNR